MSAAPCPVCGKTPKGPLLAHLHHCRGAQQVGRDLVAALAGAKPRRSKYGNLKVYAGGATFDSQKEYKRFLRLGSWYATGAISLPRRQVRYKLKVQGLLVCTYVADFVYRDYHQGGKLVIEDVKGFRTREFRLKAKLFRALTGRSITCT